MNSLICITLYALLLQSTDAQGKEKVIKKRQIYREQVLPHAGGKIPDTAFQTDRLLLNRLQKEGFAIPDGVILEQRNPQVFPYYNRASRPVYRVEATRDGRYTPIEGRYIYRIPPGIETTYLYPQVHNAPLRFPPIRPITPQIRPLVLPSPYATDNFKSLAVSNRNNKNTLYVFTVGSKNSHITSSGSSNSIISGNGSKMGPKYLPPDLIAPSLFSHFDNLFDGYNFRVTRSTNNNNNGVKSSMDSNNNNNNKNNNFMSSPAQILRNGQNLNSKNPNLSSVPMVSPVRKGS